MLKNLKIRTRLLLSYVVIIFLCLCASIVALIMLNHIGDNLTIFYDNNYTVTVNVATAGPQHFLNNHLHIIIDTAFTRGVFPASEAAKTRINLQFSDTQRLHIQRLLFISFTVSS